MTDAPLAVVIGGASGIGGACSWLLASNGWHVVIADRSVAAAARTVEHVEATGGSAECLECDANDPAAVERVAVRVADRRVMCLVNVVGGATIGSVLELPMEEWEAQLRFNLTSTWQACRTFADMLAAAGPSSIVNFASGMAFRPAADRAGYAAAKAGVVSLTRSLAAELAPRGVRVNAVSPGFIATERVLGDNPPELQAKLVEQIPLGRAGTPEEVAAAVVFLAGQGSSFITGQVIHVNGGSWMP